MHFSGYMSKKFNFQTVSTISSIKPNIANKLQKYENFETMLYIYFTRCGNVVNMGICQKI